MRRSCDCRQLHFRVRLAAARQATDLAVAQAVVAKGEDLAGNGDPRDLPPAALVVLVFLEPECEAEPEEPDQRDGDRREADCDAVAAPQRVWCGEHLVGEQD